MGSDSEEAEQRAGRRSTGERGHRDSLALYLDRTYGRLPEPGQVGGADFPLSFRLLTQADIDQKAWVHSRTWRQTYRGLLPGPLVQLVSPDFAKNVTLRHHDFAHCLLAFAGPRVIGYAEWAPSARPPFVDPDAEEKGDCATPVSPVELEAIYLLDRYQHKGIGTRLFQAVEKAAGSPARMMLWVHERNLSAQRFYRHLGFRPTGQTQSEDGGRMVEQAWLRE
jgi:GNAT superfamily N-acetyltransferase